MPSQSASGNRPPRIYCIAASTLSRDEDWSRVLMHAAGLGFDSLLLSDCGSVFLSVDEQTNNQRLQELASACHAQGLRLLLDLAPDVFPLQHPLAASHAGHFFRNEEDRLSLPDPRICPSTVTRHAQLRLDAAGLELAHHYWQHHLAAWKNAGIDGFRCLGLTRPASWFWRELIGSTRAAAPDTLFIAWTPGTPADQLPALVDCGFDYTVASDAWWDYRSTWLLEERQRLMTIAPLLSAPEEPMGQRLTQRLHAEDSASATRAYRRALQTAAATADGWLISAGFEFGNASPLADLAHNTEHWLQHRPFDLGADIAAMNQTMKDAAARNPSATLLPLSAPHADLMAFLRKHDAGMLLTVINADLHHPHPLSSSLLADMPGGWALPDGTSQPLQAAEVRTLPLQPLRPIVQTPTGGKAGVVRAAKSPRIAIEQVAPVVDSGRFPAKRIAGSHIEVEADIFGDGHDKLAAAVLWRTADDKQWQEVTMHLRDNDRWQAVLPLQRIGRHLFAVHAWRDHFATFRDELDKKHHAGLNVSLELQEGRLLIEKTLAQQGEGSEHVAALKKLLKQLPSKSRKKLDDKERAQAVQLFLASDTAALMRAADLREFRTQSDEYRIDVERRAAEFSNWYELFPRSQSGDTKRHGTFDDVIARIPAVRDMGFDTLYFPPIHPIGKKNMKGKNNTLTPSPDDPGSPYAIGSPDGGHDAVHPQLGTLDDFRRMLRVAREHGLEIALDFAIQCSPDHPWLQQHPEWFAWRPDGTIRYAENPPKKYEDIVNVDFYATEGDHPAIPDLWIALRDVVLMWVREEVRVFRVDNPHTKPLPFWEWMINEVRSRYPDVIFLSEAFTRPKPMYRLAKVGFSQSYTYFTWRHTKQEFIDYLTELTANTPPGGPREFFRPHFFVNTPDINPYFLQRSGRAGFVIRAALAATLSGLWGVYSGFELCEAQAVTGKEEYLDSEKYEIRAWDWQRPGNIVREVTQLNRIRNGNPALHSHLNVRFHTASSEQILYFSKSTRGATPDRFGDNTLLVAINLDPFAAHEARIDVPLWRFGLPDDAEVEVEDLMNETRFVWRGRQQQIRLDPQQMPFAIWRVRPR